MILELATDFAVVIIPSSNPTGGAGMYLKKSNKAERGAISRSLDGCYPVLRGSVSLVV